MSDHLDLLEFTNLSSKVKEEGTGASNNLSIQKNILLFKNNFLLINR